MTVLSHLSSSELYAPSPTSTIPPMLLGDASSWGQLRGRAWVTRGFRGQRKRGTLSAVKAQALPQRDRWQPGERTPPADTQLKLRNRAKAGLTGPGAPPAVAVWCGACARPMEGGEAVPDTRGAPAHGRRCRAQACLWCSGCCSSHPKSSRPAGLGGVGRPGGMATGWCARPLCGARFRRRTCRANRSPFGQARPPGPTSAETGRSGAALGGIYR